MPAVSRAQRIAAAIAEHEPDKLLPKNRGMLKMSHKQLHEFAARVQRAKKRKAKGGKGAKHNPYAIGLGQDIPKSRSDVHKSGEPK